MLVTLRGPISGQKFKKKKIVKYEITFKTKK